MDVEILEPTDSLSLDFKRAIEYMENNLSDLRDKYLDTWIVKNFTDDTTGHERQYAGTISSINWDRGEGVYLFHVEYDSDSDEEDLYLWEVKKYETREPTEWYII